MYDLRYAWRTLRRSPWYTGAVVFVLGLGIALATVVFAVVDGVLFKPLPYPRPHELFLVRADVTGTPGAITTGQAQPPPVSGIEIDAWAAALPDIRLTVISGSHRFERIHDREYWGAEIDDRFFDVVGMRPLLGGFGADDFNWQAARPARRIYPVLVSYRYWQRELGGDPGAIGRTVEWQRDGVTYGSRVAGVLPPEFIFPADPDEPQPEMLTPIPKKPDFSNLNYHVLFRAAPPSDLASVRDRLVSATRHAAAVAPPEHHQRHTPFDSVRLVPAAEQLGRHERPAFALVFCAASVLLLLACLNVAGLAAARNLDRRRDLAVRRALGAGARAIARGVLAEVGLLAAASVGLAWLLAKPMLMWTLALLPGTITLLKTPALDGRVLVAALMFAMMTITLVTIWPARVAVRSSGPASLGTLSTASTSVGRRSSFVLVAAQIALGFVLLTAGALTVASFSAAWLTDAGYRRDRMILVEAYIRSYTSAVHATEQLVQLADLLARIPGVERVATSSINPLFRSSTDRSYTALVPSGWVGNRPSVALRRVSGNFFDVMNIRLREGRWPVGGEWSVDQPIAIVSETAARTLWPAGSAIGQTLVAENPRRRQIEGTRTVIGIVRDARYTALDRDPVGEIYVPDRFEPGRTGVFFHVRTNDEASSVVPRIAQALKSPALMVNQISTHEDALFASVKHRALPAWLFGSLGLAALALAGTGILGLLAMSAARRTREMGIRIALGATATRVVTLVFREQLSAVAAGLIAGGSISVWAVRFVGSQLYGVRPFDPVIWSAVAVVLILAAILGTLVPSLRAARVNPVDALRAE